MLIVVSFAGAKGPANNKSSADVPKKEPDCTSPVYRQFDFWAGDWDAFEINDPSTVVAHVPVKNILNGCVLLEDYRGEDGLHGQSFTLYDGSRKVWHQSWVTNRGQLLVIEGTLEAGAMVLTGSDLTPEGKKRKVRGVWKPVEGGVRETAETSIDGGKTWQPWFDLMFRHHKE